MNKEEAIKYLQQLYPNGGHCWLDEQRIEAISMAVKALQEEPVREDFENALAEEWKGYNDRGAAKVDALEDNTQELAFAKGFYRGWHYKQEEPVSEGLEDAAKNHAVERYKATRDMVLAEKCKWSFKAGAQWQKKIFGKMHKGMTCQSMTGKL